MTKHKKALQVGNIARPFCFKFDNGIGIAKYATGRL